MSNQGKTIALITLMLMIAWGMVGCVEGEEKLTLYPDGSGKVSINLMLSEQASATIDAMVQQTGQRLEEVLWEQLLQNSDIALDFPPDVKATKKGKRYAIVSTGYFKDIRHASNGLTTIDKMKDGSFVLTSKGKKIEKEALEEMKRSKEMLKGMKMTLVIVCPGDVATVEGFDGNKGREARYVLDADKILTVMEKGDAFVQKATCKTAVKALDAEIAKFRSDYAAAEKKAASSVLTVSQEKKDAAIDLNNKGMEHYEKGEWDKAIQFFTKAIGTDPTLAAAYVNRAMTHYNKNALDAAIADATNAVKYDPKDSNAWHTRGLAYKGKGEHDKAIVDFTKSIELDPKAKESYLMRSGAYYEKGNWDQVIADCTKALQIDASMAEAYNNRAIAYYEKGDWAKCVADGEKAIQLDASHKEHLAPVIKDAKEKQKGQNK